MLSACFVSQNFLSFLVLQSSRWGGVDGCFTFVAFNMPCRCYRSLILHRGAVGWSVVCDCGISWSYSLTFFFIL